MEEFSQGAITVSHHSIWETESETNELEGWGKGGGGVGEGWGRGGVEVNSIQGPWPQGYVTNDKMERNHSKKMPNTYLPI